MTQTARRIDSRTRSMALVLIGAGTILASGEPAAGEPRPVVEFMGHRFVLVKGTGDGFEHLAFDAVNRHVHGIPIVDECGEEVLRERERRREVRRFIREMKAMGFYQDR